MTLFEQCCEAVDEAWGVNASDDPPSSEVLVKAVLQTVLENTGSPRTVEELTRILAEAG